MEYMELELRSVEVQGAHVEGGTPRGVGRTPTLVAKMWAPSADSFASIFYIFQNLSPWIFRSFRELLLSAQ